MPTILIHKLYSFAPLPYPLTSRTLPIQVIFDLFMVLDLFPATYGRLRRPFCYIFYAFDAAPFSPGVLYHTLNDFRLFFSG